MADETAQPTGDEDATARVPWTIRIIGEHLSIKDFVWEEVPPFAVLTGPNGIGKSHLLSAIREGASVISEGVDSLMRADEARRNVDVYLNQLNRAEANLNGLLAQGAPGRDVTMARRTRDSVVKSLERTREAMVVRLPNPLLQVDGVTPWFTEEWFGSVEVGLRPEDVVLVADAFQTIRQAETPPAGLAATVRRLLEDASRHRGNRDQRHAAERMMRGLAESGLRLAGSDGDPSDDFSEEDLLNAIVRTPGLLTDMNDPARGVEIAFLQYRAALVRHFLAHGTDRAAATRAVGRPPWEIIDEVLESAGFPYKVVAPSSTSLYDPYTLTFEAPNGTVTPSMLSSGERTLLGIVCALFAGGHGGGLPRLLLLDEPDAHLHPSITERVLHSIRDRIVGEYGVRVILTTHSPSTVALSPDESVFVMKRCRVERPADRWAAVSKLTTGIVTVGPSTKHVFTEDQDDVEFYEAVLGVLESNADLDFPSGRLAFLRANKDTNRPGGGGRAKVIEWVSDMDAPHVFGLIDYDDGDTPGHPRVRRIGRYAIENYLLDPPILAAFLSRDHSPIVVVGFEPFAGKEGAIAEATSAQVQAVVDGVAAALLEAWDEADRPTTTERRRVDYVTGQSVEMPAWLHTKRGKDLVSHVKATFGKGYRPDALRAFIASFGMVPTELADVLRQIAES
ncbi:AAA family ATPase [Rubrivirga marina]|uniref:ATPase AAA-type core domain-containing protein n=1 Tax=Rubrivirga marina TaxID=1196024 RepID=A0A271J396_9BACT|nr:AAA family ATPase [Rubrivirga marina]PAP78001.1 hypothetical protein BSZ37_16915 [Rubrivirga marina]